MLHWTIFRVSGAANIGCWDGVTPNIDDRHVIRNNLSKIRDRALQAFEAGSKTCNVKIAQKIVREPVLHGIKLLH